MSSVLILIFKVMRKPEGSHNNMIKTTRPRLPKTTRSAVSDYFKLNRIPNLSARNGMCAEIYWRGNAAEGLSVDAAESTNMYSFVKLNE